MTNTVRRRSPVSVDSSVMAAGTLLSRLTGVGRLVALAYALGIHSLADAYNLANTSPNMIYDLILGGILSATLIPVFVDWLSTRSERDAWEAMSAVVTLAALVLILATAAFALAAPYFIRAYTVLNHSTVGAEERAVATYLLRLFAPQVAFYGFITLIQAVLNARNRFAAPAFAPIVNNVVVIGLLLGIAVVEQHPTLAQANADHTLLLVLGIGTTAGVLLQAVSLLPSLAGAQAKLHWRWDPGHEAVRTILRLSGWTFGFVVANQVALFVVLILAVGVGPGTVSAYTYAYMFFQLPFGIIAVSIMGSMQPDLARRWAQGNLNSFRHQVSSGLRATLSAMVPAAVGYVVLAQPVVSLLLGHGQASNNTRPAAQALTYLALGLPGFCAYLYLMRVYQAMQDTRTPFFLYLFENALNIVLAVALYRPFGIRGLALSLSVAYTAGSVVALIDLRRRIGGVDGAEVAKALLRAVLLSAVMGAVVALVAAVVGSDHGVQLLVRVVVSVIAGVTVFVGVAGLAAQLSAPRRGQHRRG